MFRYQTEIFNRKYQYVMCFFYNHRAVPSTRLLL